MILVIKLNVYYEHNHVLCYIDGVYPILPLLAVGFALKEMNLILISAVLKSPMVHSISAVCISDVSKIRDKCKCFQPHSGGSLESRDQIQVWCIVDNAL